MTTDKSQSDRLALQREAARLKDWHQKHGIETRPALVSRSTPLAPVARLRGTSRNGGGRED
jgi:hypothetical protein